MWKGISRVLEEPVETEGQKAQNVKRLVELHSRIVEGLFAREEAHSGPRTMIMKQVLDNIFLLKSKKMEMSCSVVGEPQFNVGCTAIWEAVA